MFDKYYVILYFLWEVFLMKKVCAILCLLLILASSLPTLVFAEDKYPGFKVEGRFLYDKDGEKVILYGVNEMSIWGDIDGDKSLTEIKKTGANAVRLVWGIAGPARKLDILIYNCRLNNMIPIIELHDATGDFSKLQSLVDYWTSPEVVEVIKRHQEYLLVNIGNEVGQTVSEADFISGYTKAISRMRDAGIHVPLIIDASSYGQDINMLQSAGPDLIEADSDKNIMFSVHMWWPYMWGHSDQEVVDEIKESVDMELPLIVGEFGHQWEESANGEIPYKSILEECHLNEVGYLAWSWGPGNNPQTFLDMTTDGTFNTLVEWGKEVCINNKHSIKNISVRPASMLKEPSTTPPNVNIPVGSLAYKKKVYVSSTESGNGNVAENAVDGNISTRWSSEYSDPQYIYVDLEDEYEIERVYIEWEAAYAGQYKIQVSNDASNWTDVLTEYNGDGDIDDIQLDTKGRYVRINCMQRKTQYGNSIFEFGVYQKGGASISTPDVTSTPIVSPTPTQDILIGDIDNNKQINSIDFAFVRQYLLGMIKLTEEQKKAADLDLDGNVTSLDFAQFRMYLLGLLGIK